MFTNICILGAHSDKCICRPFPQTLLAQIFHLCSSQVLDQPVKLSIIHELQLFPSLLDPIQCPATGMISHHYCLWGPTGMRLQCNNHTLFSCWLSHAEPSVQRKSRIFFFSGLIIRSSLWGHRLKERWHSASQVETMGIWATPHAACALRACLSPVSFISLLFDNEDPLSMLNIIAWWTRQHQFAVGSSGHMVTWWAVIEHSVSTKDQ